MTTIEVTRRVPLVRCAYGTNEERLRNDLGSCGALIPYRATRPCPECGRRQSRAFVPEPPPGATIVRGTALLVEGGEIVAAQIVSATSLAADLEVALRGVPFDEAVSTTGNSKNEARLSGLVVSHRTFGYSAPAPLRKRWGCAASRLDIDYPDASEVLRRFCERAASALQTAAPAAYASTLQAVGPVAPCWRLGASPWTSGIINHTAALPYHRDSGNFEGSWSAMLAARRSIGGGLLHLADYDVWLEIPHGSITLFDGQSIVHGVSPFTITGPNPHRFTVVAYAKKGMRSCSDNPSDETRRAARAATEAADRQAAKLRSSKTS